MTSRRDLRGRLERLERRAAAAGGDQHTIIRWEDVIRAAFTPEAEARGAAIDAAIASGDVDMLDLILGADPPPSDGLWGSIVEAAHAAMRDDCRSAAAKRAGAPPPPAAALQNLH